MRRPFISSVLEKKTQPMTCRSGEALMAHSDPLLAGEGHSMARQAPPSHVGQ